MSAWSPDSRWLAYTKQLPNHLRAVFVYSLDTHKTTQVTDGMSDCLYPEFDKNGKYLYFTASTDMGLSAGWLDMTSEAHPVTRSVYVAVLRKDLPSPLAPRKRRGQRRDSRRRRRNAAATTSPRSDKPQAPDEVGRSPSISTALPAHAGAADSGAPIMSA